MHLPLDATPTSSLRAGMLGALLLAITLAGYAVYELILRPRAGFPLSLIHISEPTRPY